MTSQPTEDSVVALGLWLLTGGGGLLSAVIALAAGLPWWIAGLAFLAGACILLGAGLYLPPILARFRRFPPPPRRNETGL